MTGYKEDIQVSLIGLDQDATAARKLYFNKERNDTTYEK
jgi:hypothetical protein